ncbi:ABC transporter permease [Nocardia sp. 2]|uniref:ABC transporter permease n=1 Tax=Nocardia acididurans TaxID=2802282 RepID=A0ABS1LZ09_9NOCA|nr:ABC transporter permease [Nocardia acididurans]MBL1073481.1 ABC transporter permease [Nocardia acididurans]
MSDLRVRPDLLPRRPSETQPADGVGTSGVPSRKTLRANADTLRANAGVAVAVLIVLLVLGWGTAPSVFASGDPLTGVPAQKLRGPSAEHWFGTDHLGRDLYTRVVHAAGLSLSATVLAVLLGLVAGAVLGLLAGAVGGIVDTAISRTVDVLLSIPELLMSLALVAVLGMGTRNVAIAVGIAFIARFTRVMRAEVLRVRQAPFVEAAFASGVRRPVVLLRHVLRNAYAPVAALAVVEFGVAVLAVASLSFLGYGAVPPTPEWGSLISEGRNFLATAWWLTTLPGLVIIALVLATQRIARAIHKDNAR